MAIYILEFTNVLVVDISAIHFLGGFAMSWWCKSLKMEAFGKSQFRNPIVKEAPDSYEASKAIIHEFKRMQFPGLILHEIEKGPEGPYDKEQEALDAASFREQGIVLQEKEKKVRASEEFARQRQAAQGVALDHS